MSFTQLDRIEKKVDKLDERLDAVDVHLAKYNSELEFHIARTTQLETELGPIVKHVEQVRGAAKLVGLLFALAGLVITYLSVKG